MNINEANSTVVFFYFKSLRGLAPVKGISAHAWHEPHLIYLESLIKQERWQRQRHKKGILFVKQGKIIVLLLRHAQTLGFDDNVSHEQFIFYFYFNLKIPVRTHPVTGQFARLYNVILKKAE